VIYSEKAEFEEYTLTSVFLVINPEKEEVMKKLVILSVAFLFLTSVAFAAPFAPELLKLSAAPAISYEFDGSDLSIPVTVSGASASLIFLVFTKDKAAEIQDVRNGYLSWHQVDNIDTCLYVSPPYNFGVGSSTVIWSGVDADGEQVDSGDYTYYMHAYDNAGEKQRVTTGVQMPNYPLGALIDADEEGLPADKPILLSTQDQAAGVIQKWEIGNDPLDDLLIETCFYTKAEGWGNGMSPCLQPDNFDYFYMEEGVSATYTIGVRKYAWTPSGEAVVQDDWGVDGYVQWSAYFSGGNADAGLVGEGDYLYTATGNHYTNEAEAGFFIIDWADGSLVDEIDITEWWSSAEDQQGGGQMNGGPNGLWARNGKVAVNCHCSCIKQLVDPLAYLDTGEDFYSWSNDNGDYTFDHNYEDTAERAWMCNDYNVGPYTYTVTIDDNFFFYSVAYDMGTVTFGLAGPDGTGLGYHALAGETAAWKAGLFVCDNDTPFDGIYTDKGSVRETDENWGGTWFIGHDSIKGTITSGVGVAAEETPLLSIETPSQNPISLANPTTMINYSLAQAGNISIDVYNVVGQKVDTLVSGFMDMVRHSVVWDASDFSSGVYFFTFKAGDFTRSMKMTVIK